VLVYKGRFFHESFAFVVINVETQCMCLLGDTIVADVGYRSLSDPSVLSNLSQSRGLLVKFTVCEL